MKSSAKHLLPQMACDVTALFQRKKLLLSFLFLFSFLHPLFSQTETKVTITGIVRDSNGAGLPNITNTQKGTPNVTTSGENKNFSINVTNERSVLVFSSVGYANQEMQVGPQTNLSPCY